MKNLPIGLLSAYVIKCGLQTPTLQDAIIVLALAAAQMLCYYVEYKKIPEIKEELSSIKASLSKEMEVVKATAVSEVQSLRNQITTANIAGIKKQESQKFRF